MIGEKKCPSDGILHMGSQISAKLLAVFNAVRTDEIFLTPLTFVPLTITERSCVPCHVFEVRFGTDWRGSDHQQRL